MALAQLASAVLPGFVLTGVSGQAAVAAAEAPAAPTAAPDAARMPTLLGMVDAALTRRAPGAGNAEGRNEPPGTARTVDVASAVFGGDDNVALFESLVGKPPPSGATAVSADPPLRAAAPAARQASRGEAPPRQPAAPAVPKPENRSGRPPLNLSGLIRWLAQPWLVGAAGAWLFGRLRGRSDPNRSISA
jgi:hypothetical protein